MSLNMSSPLSEKKARKKIAEEPQIAFIQKVIGNDTYLVMAQSAVEIDDDWASLYFTTENKSNLFLQPPFEPKALQNLVATNNTLAQCVEAMEVNIDGTGHDFVPPDDTDTLDMGEVKEAKAFFDEPYPQTSFTTIRRKMRRQLESVGYAYLEVLRSLDGTLVGIRNLETVNVRMVKLDAPVLAHKTLIRNDKEVKFSLWVRERRYAQMVGTNNYVYYREFGSSRELDRSTGDWESKPGEIPAEMRGTELLVFGVHPDVVTPYHVPRWVNNMPAVVGSRKAEEQNLEFLDAGGLPPAIIFVQGGTLGKSTADQLRAYLSGKNKNLNRAVVVEAQSTSGSLESAGGVQVKVERFGAEKAMDSMYSGYDALTAEHVRCAFRIAPLFLGKAADYNFACYSDDTETLTDHGWVNRKDYRPGMKVAAVDPATGTLRFELPQALSVYDVADVSMYHFHGLRDDVLVTPRHRMLFRGSNNGSYRVSPVEDMTTLSKVRVRKTVQWEGGVPLQDFSPPHVVVADGPHAYKQQCAPIPAPEFLELLGWYVSEGHTLKTTYAVITQHPSNHLDQIRTLAGKLASQGYVVREQALPNGCVQVMLGDYSLVQWLKQELGEGAANKHLPAWALDLPEGQLRTLFDTLMLGDGTWDSRPSRASGAYSTTSPLLADQVQEIALKLGYSATVRQDRPGTYGASPTYRVLICGADESEWVMSRNLSRVPYTGKVHCFTVSTGVYVTRRNGRVAVQGNTAMTTYMVTEAQVFAPERLEFDEAINMTLMKALGFKNIRFKSNPITLKDVGNQLKGLELAKDKADGESFIKEVNDLVGLNLEKGEEPPPPPEQVPGAPQPTQGAPASKLTPTPSTSTTAGVKPPAQKGERYLSTLAEEYAALKGLTRKREFSPEEAAALSSGVAGLSAGEYAAFTALLATLALGSDDPDLVHLTACSHTH